MRQMIPATLFVLSCACMCATMEAQAPKQKKNDAVLPLERKDKNSVNLHNKFLGIAKEGKVDVLFLGDSITQGWAGSGKEAWKKTFEPLKAANFGIGGDRTQHVIWRITEGKELEGINPKVAVMMIGTNNAGGNSATEIADGIKEIVSILRKQKPSMKILLLGVFPRGGKNPKLFKDPMKAAATELNPKIKQINDILASTSWDKDVQYLDIGSKFLDSDGALEKGIMPDFLHLSSKGYEIWTEAIEGKVKEMLK